MWGGGIFGDGTSLVRCVLLFFPARIRPTLFLSRFRAYALNSHLSKLLNKTTSPQPASENCEAALLRLRGHRLPKAPRDPARAPENLEGIRASKPWANLNQNGGWVWLAADPKLQRFPRPPPGRPGQWPPRANNLTSHSKGEGVR